jgi:Asp-tRNA(Asn)/Glu-tRNA(Gln) amidotransferase B subunit
MRRKDTQIEYNYFSEPNICPIPLEDEFINNVLQHLNKTPYEIVKELKSKNLKSELIDQLLNDFELYKVFNTIESKINDINLVVS